MSSGGGILSSVSMQIDSLGLRRHVLSWDLTDPASPVPGMKLEPPSWAQPLDEALVEVNPKLPIVAAMTCLNGYFHDVFMSSLAEALHVAARSVIEPHFDRDRQKAADAGFDDHLVKPVSIVDIERTLAKFKKSGA